MAVIRCVRFYLVFSLLMLVGCTGDDEIVGTGGKEQINGAAHKGPFIIGSNVTVNLLAANGQATTDTIITSTSDDLGNFSFQLDKPSLVQIKVDGYHFNEISGTISNGPITLNASYDTNNSTFVVVNVLTHLINNRVRYLIGQGTDPGAAITQAQSDLISALSSILLVDSLPDFTQLSVYNLDGTDPTGNAYLLALSATLNNYASIEVDGDSGLLSGKLAEIVNTLAADLEIDGTIDSTNILNGLASATTSLNPDEIELNLVNRSIAVLGEALEVPDINLFIDTDQDGIVNTLDEDDDGDGIPDVSDPTPYTYNNIPTQETFSIAIDSNPAVGYTEVQDNSFISGYQTKLSAHLDETRVVKGVITPTPTINLLHHQDNNSKIALFIYLPSAAPGTYFIDDTTKLRYLSYTDDRYNFRYRAESGEITIDEYGDVGNAVAGSYNVTISCVNDLPQCQTGKLLQLTGQFNLIRDDVQTFQSVGTLTNPRDLGSIPNSLVQPNYSFQPFVFDGENFNLVSPTAPSYYKFSVSALNQYTVEIPSSIGGVTLSVYGSASFDSPLCESALRPATCTVTPLSNALYFTVTMLNPNTSGAWYNLSVDMVSFLDEGTINNPIDIGDQSSYFGQVATVGSFYRLSVTPETTHNIALTNYYGSIYMEVATDKMFTNVVCNFPQNIKSTSCNIYIDSTIGELFLKVTTAASAEGSYYNIESREITSPIYQLQLLPTPVVDSVGICASANIYEEDGTPVAGLHIDYTDCATEGFSANAPLEPGKTYYLELIDGLGTSITSKVDYYAAWLGSSKYSGTLVANTPDPSVLEPDNNWLTAAESMDFETLYYGSFSPDLGDIDWFKITIPDTGSSIPTPESARLDMSFSGNGVEIFDSGFRSTNDDTGNAIRIDANGRLLVTGYTHNADGNFDSILLRYTADGAIDNTFGYDYDNNGVKDGFAVHDNGVGAFRTDIGHDLEIDTSGRIVVVGESENGTDSDLLLMRYDGNGLIDAGFGTRGIVTQHNAAGGNGGDAGKALTLDAVGNILIAGHSMNSAGNFDLTVWRYLKTGEPDTTFGGDYDKNGEKDGFVVHNNAAGGNGNDFGNAITVDAQGRILVAGQSLGTGTPIGYNDNDMVIWRFSSDGQLDTSFGGDYDNNTMLDGFVKHDGASAINSADGASAIKIDSSGSIIVVGSSYNNTTQYDMIIWSFTEAGVLNSSFGGNYDSDSNRDGFVKYVDASTQVGRSLDIDADGKIIVVGWNGNYELATWRYTLDGQLDSTFGDAGVKNFSNAPVAGRGHQMVIDANGKIVIVGLIVTGGPSAFDLALWRLIP